MPATFPPGLGLNPSTGAVTGTPVTSGTYTFTVQVKDANGLIARVSDTVIIYKVVVTGAAPYGSVGASYTYTGYAATGGTGPYTWDISAGALPGGVSMAGATGYLSGTPTTEETATFTVRATDSLGYDGVLADEIQIDATGGPWITQYIPGANTVEMIRSAYGEDWSAAATTFNPLAACTFFRYFAASGITAAWSPGAPATYITSADGGRSWTARNSGLSGGSGGGRCVNGNSYYFVAMSSGNMGRSTDLINWTQSSDINSRCTAFIAMGAVLYLIHAATTFYSSSDDAVSWSDTGIFFDPEFEGGVTDPVWKTNGPNDYDGTYSILCFKATGNKRRIYRIGLTLADVTLVYSVPDTTTASFKDVAFDGDSGWVATTESGEIFYSTDAGVTWATSATTLTVGASDMAVASDGQRFVIAHSGGVSYSTTGATWTTVVPSEGAVAYYGVCFTLPVG